MNLLINDLEKVVEDDAVRLTGRRCFGIGFDVTGSILYL